MPDKLTDSEIVKALKEILELMLCEGDLQRSATISNALDLINRQDEELNRLQAENERLFADNQKFLSVMLWGNKNTGTRNRADRDFIKRF